MGIDPKMLEALQAPFPESDVSWRIQRSGTTSKGIWAAAVPYLDKMVIMDRLDAVCGAHNWCNLFQEWHGSAQLCGISISFEGGPVVTKWDGADAKVDDREHGEPIKAGLTDSFKRAAAVWGIGRYLQAIDAQLVEIAERRLDQRWLRAKESGTVYFWLPPALPENALPPKQGKPLKTEAVPDSLFTQDSP